MLWSLSSPYPYPPQLLDIQPQLAQHERRERETSLQTEIIMGHASVLTQMSVMALDKWSEMLQSTLNKINTIKVRDAWMYDVHISRISLHLHRVSLRCIMLYDVCVVCVMLCHDAI